MQEYQYDIVHKQGRVHQNADALSRRSYENEAAAEQIDTTVNSAEPLANIEHKQYVQVEFTYQSPPNISVAESTNIIINEELPKELEGKTVADLQKESTDFQGIFKYLESNILPDD